MAAARRGRALRAAWLLGGGLALALPGRPACAWGDEGHEVVGLIAEHYLSRRARAAIRAMLAHDASGLTRDGGIAAESTWADHYRDSDRGGSESRYRATRAWHFIDLELEHADFAGACHGHPALPSGTAASQGPADDCITDKIEQFRRELADPATPAGERLVALQFILHLVGDVHQPLHASDDHDRGGNGVAVRLPGARGGSLHHYWDTVFVERLGRDSRLLARASIDAIGNADVRRWRGGGSARWARESYGVAKSCVYAPLPPPAADGVRVLTEAYAAGAAQCVRLQLQRAGVRLAALLNRSF